MAVWPVRCTWTWTVDRCPSPTLTRSFSRDIGVTKMDLILYYIDVADGALRGVAGRPMILKRFVKGITEEAVFQKRAPEKRPDFVDVAELKYASGTSAKEAVIRDAAGLVWAVNLGCVDLNPHPVRADDLGPSRRAARRPRPDAGRDVAPDRRRRAGRPRGAGGPRPDRVAEDLRIARLPHLRADRAALAVQAGSAGRRDGRPRGGAPRARTWRRAGWWKEEREGVFVDFNQNAKDRTVASAYSVRATPDARVSTPLFVGRGADCRPEEFTIATVPERFEDIGDPVGGHRRQRRHAGRAARAGRASSARPRRRRRAQEGHGPAPNPSMPLIEIARTKTKDEAMAALDEWRARYPSVAEKLEPADVLVDGMRGPSSIWYRIRINLQHVPEDQRPAQEPLLADYDPWENYSGPQWMRRG